MADLLPLPHSYTQLLSSDSLNINTMICHCTQWQDLFSREMPAWRWRHFSSFVSWMDNMFFRPWLLVLDTLSGDGINFTSTHQSPYCYQQQRIDVFKGRNAQLFQEFNLFQMHKVHLNYFFQTDGNNGLSDVSLTRPKTFITEDLDTVAASLQIDEINQMETTFCSICLSKMFFFWFNTNSCWFNVALNWLWKNPML